MLIGNLLWRWLTVPYRPAPDNQAFLSEAVSQSRNGLDIRVAVLDGRDSRTHFGVSLDRRGIQPVWIEVVNQTDRAYRLQFVSIDPNYFSPLEAAAACHYKGLNRLFEFGALAWIFFPFLLLLPIKFFAGRRANRQMDAFFSDQAFRMRPVPAGGKQSGFVFTNLSEGTKVVMVRFLGYAGTEDFEFSIPVKGLDVDYLRREFHDLHQEVEIKDMDLPGLRQYLTQAPAATTNRQGKKSGDPVNLVIIGNFPSVISAFGARWDETEVITLETCWKTCRAFLTGSEYRYSPVSGLYLFSRTQDFALQRIRNSINERLHLRLWTTPTRFQGQTVWIGQVSRDIGVRFTWKTWNLTTHRIDPDVDEARDYVVEDLLHIGRVQAAAYVDGVGATQTSAPRRNLTGDPYYTDGKRAVLLLSETRTAPKLIALA
ncbi:MAG: LssY C-terminal domain-containing protein [Planctomycetaceae bacterium]